MIGNLIWLSLINIKRRIFGSILFFIMASFISNSLFLINISRNLLRFPDFTEMRQFFYNIIYSVLIVSIFIIAAISVFYISLRRSEYGIMRIYGARKTDILLLSVFEVFFISFTGAVAGILCILFLIYLKIIYLPYLFEGMKKLEFLQVMGIGGQTIFAVIIIETAITLILLVILLKNDINNLVRGSY